MHVSDPRMRHIRNLVALCHCACVLVLELLEESFWGLADLHSKLCFPARAAVSKLKLIIPDPVKNRGNLFLYHHACEPQQTTTRESKAQALSGALSHAGKLLFAGVYLHLGHQRVGKDSHHDNTMPWWVERHPLHRPLQLCASSQSTRRKGSRVEEGGLMLPFF